MLSFNSNREVSNRNREYENDCSEQKFNCRVLFIINIFPGVLSPKPGSTLIHQNVVIFLVHNFSVIEPLKVWVIFDVSHLFSTGIPLWINWKNIIKTEYDNNKVSCVSKVSIYITIMYFRSITGCTLTYFISVSWHREKSMPNILYKKLYPLKSTYNNVQFCQQHFYIVNMLKDYHTVGIHHIADRFYYVCSFLCRAAHIYLIIRKETYY